MAAKVSQLLVIDASVANAAGGEEAIHPTAKHCRDFLLAVLDICHRVVMTSDIRDEWTKHESNFARTWRRQMVANKKLEYRADIQINEELWKQIEGTAGGDREREAMFKDFLLIVAALATDKTVISLDERVRGLFGQAAGRVPAANPRYCVGQPRESRGGTDRMALDPVGLRRASAAWEVEGQAPARENFLLAGGALVLI